MPDALEQFAEETIEELLKNMPVERRIKGLSVDDLVAALSPEKRAALAQRLKDSETPATPESSDPGDRP
jgi:hypothetical protein